MPHLLYALLRRLRPSDRSNTTRRAAPLAPEPLEARRLLSAGPQLVSTKLLGTWRAVTGVVFTFDRSLDPTSAQDLNAYSIGHVRPKSSGSDNSGLLAGLLGFARPRAKAVKNNKVVFASAVYDDATHSVTLTPVGTFRIDKFFRAVRIHGNGADGIKDTAGNFLDGNNDGTGGDDALMTFFFHKGNHIHYVDRDGDRVTVTLHGRGRMLILTPNQGNGAPFIFLEKPKPTKSILSGVVSRSSRGDGKAVLEEVSGVVSAQTPLLSDPSFQVISTQP